MMRTLECMSRGLWLPLGENYSCPAACAPYCSRVPEATERLLGHHRRGALRRWVQHLYADPHLRLRNSVHWSSAAGKAVYLYLSNISTEFLVA